MRHVTVLVAILAFTPLASATAQVPVGPGARVRVTGHFFCQPLNSNCMGGLPQRYVGTLVTWEADTLVVQSNGDTLSVPANLVTRLDVSRGRKTNTGMGAGIGFLVGGVAGAVVGYGSYEECVPQGFLSCLGAVGPESLAFAGALIGGFGGLVTGALIGSAIETDHWQEVQLDRVRVSFGPQRTGKGAGIGFLLGGVMGAVAGYASYEKCLPQGWFSCIGPDFGPEAGGLGGLMVGAIIGGSPEVRLDRLRVSLGLQRYGGFGLGASVSF